MHRRKSKGTFLNEILNSAESSNENKNNVSKIIIKVVEKNPEKAVEILEKNEKASVIAETIKTKIENEEAITTEDFDEVFDTNVSPN